MTMRALPLLLAALTLTAGGTAAAQPYGEPNSVDEVVVEGFTAADREVKSEAVSYADLDLDGQAGVYTLLRRIERAARDVCSPEPSRLIELRDNADFQDCMAEARDQAVADIDAPLVQDIYHPPG